MRKLAVWASLGLLAGCQSAILDDTQLPAAMTNAQYGLEACHARFAGQMFLTVREYANCRLAVERQAVATVRLSRTEIFNAHEGRVLTLVADTEAAPITQQRGEAAGQKLIEYTIALYNTVIETHALTEQRRAEARAFLQAYILARASATRVNINQ